jgi:hypothetical protein
VFRLESRLQRQTSLTSQRASPRDGRRDFILPTFITPNDAFQRKAEALAVANALECPECLEGLRDALNDSVVNELTDLLSSNNSALLRALARVHTELGASDNELCAYCHAPGRDDDNAYGSMRREFSAGCLDMLMIKIQTARRKFTF